MVRSGRSRYNSKGLQLIGKPRLEQKQGEEFVMSHRTDWFERTEGRNCNRRSFKVCNLRVELCVAVKSNSRNHANQRMKMH